MAVGDPNLIHFQDLPAPSSDPAEEMDLLYYVQVVRKHRFLIGSGVVLSLLVATLVSLLLSPEFEATATILPVRRSSSSRMSSLLSNLGTLADLPGLSDGIPEESSDLLTNVLESRTIAARIIEKESLMPRLFESEYDAERGEWRELEPSVDEAIEKLRDDILSVSDNNRGLISITARFGDPAVAAGIANAAAESLEEFLKNNKITAAGRTRDFLRTRLDEVGTELVTAEEALREFCEKNGVISMPEQTRLLFEQIATLSSELALKRARLQVLEKFGGASNPEATRIQAEIESIEKEVLDLERGVRRSENPMIQSNGFIPLYHVPEKSLQYSRLLREVRVKQEVLQFLRTESEAARIRLTCEEIAFTLLDPAVPPERPVRPKPLLIISLAGIFSALATFMTASFLEYLSRHRSNLS